MPRPRKYATVEDALEARRRALQKYATPEEARLARCQQMRQWRREGRERRLAEQAAITRLSQSRPPRSGTPAPYIPTSTYCPGVLAFAILYGERR